MVFSRWNNLGSNGILIKKGDYAKGVYYPKA